MDAFVEWRQKVGTEYTIFNNFLSSHKNQHRRTIYYRKLLQVAAHFCVYEHTYRPSLLLTYLSGAHVFEVASHRRDRRRILFR